MKKKLIDWNQIAKLTYEERYQRMASQFDGRQYLKDRVTGETHSFKRQLKKDILRTLKWPTGRQYRKEMRYLKSLNVNSEN